MYARDVGDCMRCANGLTMCDFSQFMGACSMCDDDDQRAHSHKRSTFTRLLKMRANVMHVHCAANRVSAARAVLALFVNSDDANATVTFSFALRIR